MSRLSITQSRKGAKKKSASGISGYIGGPAMPCFVEDSHVTSTLKQSKNSYFAASRLCVMFFQACLRLRVMSFTIRLRLCVMFSRLVCGFA
jgi:hypothetical protein